MQEEHETSAEDTATEPQSLAPIDIENRQAYRDNEFDGDIEWTLQTLICITVLCMNTTGAQLPGYFTAGTLRFIAAYFDDTTSNFISWLPIAYSLATASTTPLVGYMQDLWGRRIITLVGSGLVCLGCLVFATSQGVGQALAGLIIAGIGAGIGIVTGISGLAEIVPVKYRGYYLSLLLVFELPFCPFVLYSQLFSTQGPVPTWRWGGWISLAYNAVALLGLSISYFPRNHPRAKGVRIRNVLKQFDSGGAVCSVAGLVLLLVGLQAPSLSHPWTSANTLGPLVTAVLLVIIFALWEAKVARYPMVSYDLFRNQHVVAASFLLAFLAGINFSLLVNFWPLALSYVWPSSPITLGLRGLAIPLALTFGTIFCNVLLSIRKGVAKWVLLGACVTFAAFSASLVTVAPGSVSRSLILVSCAAVGLGGMTLPTATVALSACPDGLIGSCTALSLSLRSIGSAIGFSISYTVYSHKLTANLSRLVRQFAVDAGLLPAEATQFANLFLYQPEKASTLPGVNRDILEAAAAGSRLAYSTSLHYVWYISVATSSCAVICSLFLPDTRRFETHRIAVSLRNVRNA